VASFQRGGSEAFNIQEESGARSIVKKTASAAEKNPSKAEFIRPSRAPVVTMEVGFEQGHTGPRALDLTNGKLALINAFWKSITSIMLERKRGGQASQE